MSAPMNEFHAMAKGHNVFFYYRGYVSQTMVEACAEALKLRLESANINYPTQRRLLSSFIEMGQNVVHYSADSLTAVDASENEVRFGVLTICREGEDGQFTLTCTNPVSQRIKDKLQGKLEVLATLSVDEIKSLYRKALRAEGEEDSKGGGIGLLTLARDSSNPIEFSFVESPDNPEHQMFTLSVTV